MSFLNRPKVRRFLALPDKHEPHTIVQPSLTLEERLGEAAADRGWAFDILEQAREALRDSAQTEYEVAQEYLRRADRGRTEAAEAAHRILETAAQSASDKEEKATSAQRNGDDDLRAFERLDDLLAKEDESV